MNNPPKEKRQIEILSLVEQHSHQYTIADLCDVFKVETATIHRDLKELREEGVRIHSTKKGIVLEKQLLREEYNKFLYRYLTYSGSAIGYPKNISLTTKKLRSQSLNIFTSIVTAIEKRNELALVYTKYSSSETVARIVHPYSLVATARDWRLITWSDGHFKQFLVM